ncbi:MAG: energy transducer TonB [Pyrinomonadaceae bacterium]
MSDYLNNRENQQNRIAEAERKAREYQVTQFGKVLPKISGHCWSGCPTRLVKPFYPQEAKHYRLFGQIVIETIVDEKGQVIFTQARKGKPFLIQTARQAACQSSYAPQLFEGKPIKFSWTIVYNFILD